mmetsp:Transcript_25533/g.55588  ORF Transcript_25533/g.55588 Transcript_25533/m.55588 type:complete len:492 (-) Transcript_25533:568-2043(-)
MAEQDHQLMWLDDSAEEPTQKQPDFQSKSNQDDVITQLEDELKRTRKELADVRKELAAKTVQLSRKEQAAVQEKVAEIAATVSSEKDKQLQQAVATAQQLEIVLAQKEEELEESRRLYTAQKKALKEALNAAAEREASDRAVDEATRTAAAQAMEDELDRIYHELVLTKTRAELELKARDTELLSLKQQLAAATSNKKQAVADAEAALMEAWQAEIDRVQQDAEVRVEELEGEVVRLRTLMEDARRAADAVSLTGELAMLNNQKVQIQREFEAFKDMATQAARSKGEEIAKLLEENANLRTKLANKTVDGMLLTSTKSLEGDAEHRGVKVFDSMGPSSSGQYSLEAYLPELLARLERQRKGLVPCIIVGSLLLLILTITIVRAAASARHQHRGPLCFLSNLGIRIGKGCGTPEIVHEAEKQIVQMLDKPQRVHDVVDETLHPALGGAGRRLLWRGFTALAHAVSEAAAAAASSTEGVWEHDLLDSWQDPHR